MLYFLFGLTKIGPGLEICSSSDFSIILVLKFNPTKKLID